MGHLPLQNFVRTPTELFIQARMDLSWLIVCSSNYYANEMPNVSPRTATGLASCIDRCANQGAQCMGVTWQWNSFYCTMKAQMMPFPQYRSGGQMYSAIRTSGPASAPGPQQAITNGGFDGGTLSPWASTLQDSDSQPFSLVDGKAFVYPSSRCCADVCEGFWLIIYLTVSSNSL